VGELPHSPRSLVALEVELHCLAVLGGEDLAVPILELLDELASQATRSRWTRRAPARCSGAGWTLRKSWSPGSRRAQQMKCIGPAMTGRVIVKVGDVRRPVMRV